MTLATQERDAALARVEDAADVDWFAEARAAVRRVAATGYPFTTDDVWDVMPAGVSTPEPRAMGAVMRGLAVTGEIVPMSEHRISKRRSCHARPLRMWMRGGVKR